MGLWTTLAEYSRSSPCWVGCCDTEEAPTQDLMFQTLARRVSLIHSLRDKTSSSCAMEYRMSLQIVTRVVVGYRGECSVVARVHFFACHCRIIVRRSSKRQ